MLLAMDKKGRLYETDSRENGVTGYGRGEEAAESGDVYLGDTAKFAESERMRRWQEIKTHNDMEKARKKKIHAAMMQKKIHFMKNESIRAAQAEERKAAHMGEDPLLVEAADQYRRGADYEILSITGNGMSADGSNNENLSGFGDWFSDVTSTVKSYADSATSVVKSVTGLVQTVAPTPVAPAPTFDAAAYQKMVNDQLAAKQAEMAKAMASAQAQAMMTAQSAKQSVQGGMDWVMQNKALVGGIGVSMLALIALKIARGRRG